MQRKPGYPVANCSIKMPDNSSASEVVDEDEPQQRRQQLINFGHVQWGFNNWSWGVTKQDLDFVDLNCGKYTAGVAAFVSITVKMLNVHRENVGYATVTATHKGSAIHQARKCAVTNALRETLLSFGGTVATALLEMDAQAARADLTDNNAENNPALANKHHHAPHPPQPQPHPPQPQPHPPQSQPHPPQPQPQPQQQPQPPEPKNSLNKNVRKELESAVPAATRAVPAPVVAAPAPSAPTAPPAVKNAAAALPIAKALPMPANMPPAANRPPRPAAPAQPPAPAPVPLQPPPPHAVPAHAQGHARPNSNARSEAADDEEARAERRRRQRAAQEQFRRNQMRTQPEEKQELGSITSSVDSLLLAIPTQDIISGAASADDRSKRKSPTMDGGAAKRRGAILSRIDS